MGFLVWVLVSRFGLDRPSLGPPFPWTALPLDRPSPGPPKISHFSLSRRKIRSFLPSLGVFSLNFGCVFEAPGPSNVHVWALWLSCGTPAAPPDRAAGARTRQPENSKRAHLSAPALQTPPKFHEKTPREGRKERILWRERKKKSAKIWAPHLGAPPFGAPPFWAPPFWAPPFGPPPFGPPLFLGLGPHPSGPHWVWPLACMKKTKQLRITKTTIEKNPNNQHKKSKQLKITKKTIKKKSKQLTQKIQTIKNHKKTIKKIQTINTKKSKQLKKQKNK